MAQEVVLMSDFDILTTTRSWVALPWDYNSCIGLRFRADGSGDMVFGSCQTIHAEINFRFSLETTNELTLIYQDSPGDRVVKTFTPNETGKSKAIQYSLKEGEITGVTANIGPFKYHWTLGLDKSPFPDAVMLGQVRPTREYYGHHVNETTRSGGHLG
jgi:hypothetical protein